jgi:endonuclease YncB( thermonuclease family)
MVASAWYLDDITQSSEIIGAADGKPVIADGDSFAIGGRKLRLHGIDAPEYRQTCNDARGLAWECGKAARAALEEMLHAPGLVCKSNVKDRYSRSIATCSNAKTLNIAAAQVANGWAVSNNFYGLRDYGSEEDDARNAKRGIWIGEFTHPRDWRTLNATP